VWNCQAASRYCYSSCGAVLTRQYETDSHSGRWIKQHCLFFSQTTLVKSYRTR
jgi:hypothetical protein